MADFTPTGLRVLVETAQSGSFTAAARALGYTQSAVSRQVAALESTAGVALFERRRDGVVLA
jgi:DNA-binding transcriptional LysR family regulator